LPGSIDVFINVVNRAKDFCGILPAQAAFTSASVLLTMIRDTMANDQDCVDPGRVCGEVCEALDRGLDEKRMDQLNRSVFGEIGQLTTTVAEMQGKVAKQGKRNVVSQFFHAKDSRDSIAAWRQDSIRILHVFDAELAINASMGYGYPHHGCGHPSELVNRAGKCFQPKPLGSATCYPPTTECLPPLNPSQHSPW